jgi:excinuclease Cho
MPRRTLKSGALNAYQYPEHLRHCLEDLPSGPGVYIFLGEHAESLPLYIGKSINIRQRVMSHFRAIDEHRLLQQTRSIKFISTAGEIGALLLEAHLIKERQPLFNQRLRRARQLCSLRICNGHIDVVYGSEIDFATTEHLYGLFPSRHAALEALRAIADAHKLCYAPLGLERLQTGRRCFRASIGQCAGLCCGLETREMYDQRLMNALARLQITCWPYTGAIGIQEGKGKDKQIHVIRNWYYLGSTTSVAKAKKLAIVNPQFDADSYRILCDAISNHANNIIQL